MFGRLLGCYTVYTFFFGGGLLLPDGNLPDAKCTLRPSLAFSQKYWQRYCTALQQRVSARLCGTVQGMELRKFAESTTYTFGWAAITLGIGLHSSWLSM